MCAYKILGIGSGRPFGNAEVVLRELLMECEKLADTEVRITRLRSLKIADCDGCLECMKNAAEGGCGKCKFNDDFAWLQEQILWADAIVLADPCFTYMPTSEVMTLMNRAMGAGQDYKDQCRQNPKKFINITVGGSDTVDFSLPLQMATMNALCPGVELVDQFYCNWVRGKGLTATQDRHLERARLGAKRLINSLMGYRTPDVVTTITKLNPMEYKDDVITTLAACPVCKQAVVTMVNAAPAAGKFICSTCGARGHIEHHAGAFSYVWDDDSVAHNRFHKEQDAAYIESYKKAHAAAEGEKEAVPEFQILTPAEVFTPDKKTIVAVVAGPKGGTSELLARKALSTATADGKYNGAIVRITDLDIRLCTGCLICKINGRYRGGVDECIIKDNDLWLVDTLLAASAVIWSFDGVNGSTYGKIYAFMQRFGHFSKTVFAPRQPIPVGILISAFDEQTQNAMYPALYLGRFFTNHGPAVGRELFNNVPLTGDNILANKMVMKKAGIVGMEVKKAMDTIEINPGLIPLLRTFSGMCPSCNMDFIELHDDKKTVSCVYCDTFGNIERRFGQNVIVWDDYSAKHSRATHYGAVLHDMHIDYSQTEDRDILDNPKLTADLLAPYKAYDHLVKPERK